MLTIGFSWRAKDAADLAKEASQTTRSKLQSLDILTELNRLSGRVDDLNTRLDAKSWLIIGERATDLRVSVAAILANTEAGFSDELKGRLTEAVNQFRNIATASHRAEATPDSTPDVARYKRIVADQKETIVLAMQEAKISLERKA